VKQDKHTFFYDDIPLFVPGGSLKDAEARISKMGTIQRKHKKRNSSDGEPMLRGPSNTMVKQSKQKRNASSMDSTSSSSSSSSSTDKKKKAKHL